MRTRGLWEEFPAYGLVLLRLATLAPAGGVPVERECQSTLGPSSQGVLTIHDTCRV